MRTGRLRAGARLRIEGYRPTDFGVVPDKVGDEDGVAVVEYAVMLGLVQAAVIAPIEGSKSMKNLLNRLQRDEDGNAMVEYAVILGLVTAAVIGLMTTIGGSVKTILTTVNTALTTAAA